MVILTHLGRVAEEEDLPGEEALSDVDQRPDGAPGLGIGHRAPEADHDDEDLEHEGDGVHGEVEAQQKTVVALEMKTSQSRRKATSNTD